MRVQIEVQGLSFQYGSTAVLEGLTLAISRGDCAGIIGPNGSGKSTLLKNMAAVLAPTGGAVLIDGREAGRWPRRSLARFLASVGQDHSSGFNFLVEEVVASGRYPHQGRFSLYRETDRRAVHRAMHLTGTYSLREREIFSLSGGERQRVFLARALAQETPVILLDEPTSFLDIGYQVELLELLQGLNRREGITVVLVMHDLNLASRYCRHLFLLHRGRLFAAGSPREVLTRENILAVYRTEVLIDAHPLGGAPRVTPISTVAAPGGGESAARGRVHVIGGGGSATALIQELFLQGFSLSTGVLNVGDEDWATARRLGLPMVEEAPFSPISAERFRDNLALGEGASVVILAPLYVGPGNLPNLEAALELLRRGHPVCLLDTPPVAERDFTGGEGRRRFRQLIAEGAAVMQSLAMDTVADYVSCRNL